jgi:hypothetical protein
MLGEMYLSVGVFIAGIVCLFHLIISMIIGFEVFNAFTSDRKCRFCNWKWINYYAIFNLYCDDVFGTLLYYVVGGCIVFPLVIILVWPLVLIAGIILGLAHIVRFMKRSAKYFKNINNIAHKHPESVKQESVTILKH